MGELFALTGRSHGLSHASGEQWYAEDVPTILGLLGRKQVE